MGQLRFLIVPCCLAALSCIVPVENCSAQSVSDTAFQWSVKLDIPDSSGFSFASYTVPTGKRLVIRYLSVTSTLPSGQRLTSSVQTTLKGAEAEFAQAYVSQNNSDGTDEVVSSQATLMQADGDTTVYFQVFRKVARGGIRVVFAFSADLIPLPTAP